MDIKKIVAKLDNVRELKREVPPMKGTPDTATPEKREIIAGWQSNCPAHSDTSRSFTINKTANGIMNVHCTKGCTYGAIMTALGLMEKPKEVNV